MWAASWPCVWQFPGYERVDRKRAEPKPNTKHEWEQIKSKPRQSTNTFQQHLTKVFQPYADQILSHLTHTNVHVRPPTPYTHIYWNMALILAFISCSQQGERKPGRRRTWLHHPFPQGVFRGRASTAIAVIHCRSAGVPAWRGSRPAAFAGSISF